MIYITGDIHGDPTKICNFCERWRLTEADTIVILGDVGANYYGGRRDRLVKQAFAHLKPIIFCIHGNHEQRPASIQGYEIKEWHGGKVWYQKEFPNLLFAKDGEIFQLGKKRFLVIGGAYSVDKYYRLEMGYGWWDDEQPSDQIKEFVEHQVEQKQIDIILTHTCPFKYEPTEMFIPGLDQTKIDNSTEKWLDEIEEKVGYSAWYCGHWHTDKHVDKIHFLFRDFEVIDDD